MGELYFSPYSWVIYDLTIFVFSSSFITPFDTGEVETSSVVDEQFDWQCFCEDVGHLLSGWYVPNVDVTLSDKIPNKMKVNFDMMRSSLNYQIACHEEHQPAIRVNGRWSWDIYAKVTKETAKPSEFGSDICYGLIFDFGT